MLKVFKIALLNGFSCKCIKKKRRKKEKNPVCMIDYDRSVPGETKARVE